MWPWTTKSVIREKFSKLRFIHNLEAHHLSFPLMYDVWRTIFGWYTTIWKFLYIYGRKFTKYLHGTWSLLNSLMIFGIKMDNFDPYNVLLAIATNIPVLLMTAFVLQGHIYDAIAWLCKWTSELNHSLNQTVQKNLFVKNNHISLLPEALYYR